jgi:hypothetical protein
MSTPNPNTSNGTITTPPPKPVNAPRKPATTDPRPRATVNSRTFIATLYGSPGETGGRHSVERRGGPSLRIAREAAID